MSWCFKNSNNENGGFQPPVFFLFLNTDLEVLILTIESLSWASSLDVTGRHRLFQTVPLHVWDEWRVSFQSVLYFYMAVLWPPKCHSYVLGISSPVWCFVSQGSSWQISFPGAPPPTLKTVLFIDFPLGKSGKGPMVYNKHLFHYLLKSFSLTLCPVVP